VSDGTSGRRGVFVAVESPQVVAWANDVIGADMDRASHADVRPFQARDPKRGAPAPDFTPERLGGGSGYYPRYASPVRVAGTLRLELMTAPENALSPGLGLLRLLGRAGAGSTVLVQQMAEPVWWGLGPEEGPSALNPRLQAYVAAAREGARVRVLLDGYFSDPDAANGNHAAVAYLSELASRDGLDLQARLGNPAGGGLHNKMVLVALSDGTRWSHVGSINGSEVASKVNREAAVNIESADVYYYLAGVFAFDWATSGANAIFLPVLRR
jgi:hypothetical protein